MAEKKTATAKTVVQAKSTEVVLGKAAQSLEQSVNRMSEGLTFLQKFQDQISDLDLQIVNKEGELKKLKDDLEQAKKSGEVELELSLRAGERKAVDTILATQGLVAISNDELHSLRKENTDLKSNIDKLVKAEVAAAINAITKNAEGEKKLLEAQFATREADNKAKISNLEDKVGFLNAANNDLKEQLNQAVKANVAIAEAAGKGSNITLGGK